MGAGHGRSSPSGLIWIRLRTILRRRCPWIWTRGFGLCRLCPPQRVDGAVRRPGDPSGTRGVPFEGRQVRLIAAQQGIWRPRFLDAALSILTTYVRPGEVPPYEDQEMGADNYPRYKWRGTDPSHPDNVGLRRAMEQHRPLMWFIGVRPGLYRARYPVWLAGEEPVEHQFVVALDETMRDAWRPDLSGKSSHDPTRRYAEVLVRQRLHQRMFQDRVMLAYDSICAICWLRHSRLNNSTA